MRIFSAVILIPTLLSCSPAQTQPQAAEGARRIGCAIGPGTDFADDCMVERITQDGDKVLIVRHSDGGFRRFVQLPDGGGLQTYDGMEQAVQRMADDQLEVTVADDRYRFPARTISGDAATPPSE